MGKPLPRQEAAGVGRPSPTPRRSEERALHINAVKYLRQALPPEVIAFHVANGEHRDLRTAQKLKAFGVLPGVSDLAFVLPGGRAAFLEFKSPRGSLSVEQKAFRDRVIAAGALFAECRSLPEVEGTLTAWLSGTGLSLRARIAA